MSVFFCGPRVNHERYNGTVPLREVDDEQRREAEELAAEYIMGLIEKDEYVDDRQTLLFTYESGGRVVLAAYCFAVVPGEVISAVNGN